MERAEFDRLWRKAYGLSYRYATTHTNREDLSTEAVTAVWRKDPPTRALETLTMLSAMKDYLRTYLGGKTVAGTKALNGYTPLEARHEPGAGDDTALVVSASAVESMVIYLADHFPARTVDALLAHAREETIDSVARRHGVTPSRLAQLRTKAQRRLAASAEWAEMVA